jgi:hypothetical protein
MMALARKNKTSSLIFRAQQTFRIGCFAFLAGCLPMSGCAKTKTEQAAVPVKKEMHEVSSVQASPAVQVPYGAQEKMSLEQKYAVEIAMGADCPKQPMGSAWHGVISDGACFGHLPTYFAQLLSALSTQRQTLLHQDAYQTLFEPVKSDNNYTFRAVPGFGQRPDILVRLSESAWVRSFEGKDPTITMYLVRAHFACNAHERRAAKKNGRFAIQLCEDSEEQVYELREDDPGLRLRLYRVKDGGAPEDVTATLLPPLPSLTIAERKRYYQYSDKSIDDNGDAVLPDDTYLFMDTYRLQYAPTLQWWLDLSPDYSLPESDPRWLGTRAAHFGFMIWTGKRFEMRERVSRSFVPCGVGDDGTIYKCIPGTNPYAQEDRFIIEDK